MNLTNTDTLATPDKRVEILRDFTIVVVAALVLFSLNVDFLLRGDSSMYADYVLLGKFDELTLHIGYYALLFAVQRTIGALLGLPVHETMVWINVVAGAFALGVMYRLAVHFLASRRDALLCVAILAVTGRVMMNATSSEIYMVQTLLVMGSFLLFVEEQTIAAGLVAGLSLLVSPLSAFTFLFFPVFDYQRSGRIRWALLLRLAGACLVIYIPYLIGFGSELLWGKRGLLGINKFMRPDPVAMLANVPRYQFKHYTVLLVLLAPALLAIRSHLRFFVLTLAVALPSLYIVLKLTSEDNVFLLNTDLFFAAWLVLGWRVLACNAIGAWAARLAFAAHIALIVSSRTIFDFDTHRNNAAQMRAIAEEYLIGKDAALVSDWDMVMTLTYFGRRSVVTTIEKDQLFTQTFDIEAVLRGVRSGPQAASIYVLDPWGPGPLNKLLRSKEAIEEQRRTHSLVFRADRQLKLDCSLVGEAPYPLYRCVRRQGVATVEPRA